MDETELATKEDLAKVDGLASDAAIPRDGAAPSEPSVKPDAIKATPSYPSPASDILHGADAIAAFLYGDRASRRKVYHLVESAQLPVFRLGTNICARKSVLIDWIEQQERGQAVSESPSGE